MGGIFQFIDIIGIAILSNYASLRLILKIGQNVDFDKKN